MNIIGVWIISLQKREFWLVSEDELKEVEKDKNIKIFARQCVE